MMIKARNIHLTLSGKKILNNFSLDIEEGQHVCLYGPSGSGKSSLLQLLQGYLLPDQGAISYNDQLLSEKSIKAIRRKISWLPQNVYLPVSSALEVMHLLNSNQKIEALHFWLKRMGLQESDGEKKFELLSGGQKQRVMIAVCFSLDSPVILLDEPTSALDDKSINQLIDIVNELKVKDEKTIVSTSHNMDWTKSADKIIRI